MDSTNLQPALVSGKWVSTAKTIEVKEKWTTALLGKVSSVDASQVEEAIKTLKAQFKITRSLKGFEKCRVLQSIAQSIESQKKDFVDLLIKEAGKTKKEAEAEVARAKNTFEIASFEVSRFEGLFKSLDSVERTANDEGRVSRFPVGPCLFITPFNFPLNLAAHKIAPAIAVGCPFIWKPASVTPMISLRFAKILLESGYPKEAISVLPCDSSLAESMVKDERFSFFSFTGASDLGWRLKSIAGKKKVALELGGNASVIVTEEWDIADAVKKILVGAFFQAGQSCISVQKVFVQKSIYEKFKSVLVTATEKLSMGTTDSDVGPLISEKEALRVEELVKNAEKEGANLLTGGKRDGAFYYPTWLEKVPEKNPLAVEEAFGPIAFLEPYEEFQSVIERVNQSRFGLQAGVLVKDYKKIKYAFDHLEVGGVVIGDVPSYRSEELPYGGIKDSGFGREGVRAAIEDMTEPKTLILRYF